MTAPTVDTPTDEAIAKRIAARAVQSLADSEPDEDTTEAQERLRGTPQESLFVVSAEVLEAFIAVAISNAIYDGELAARREVEALRETLRYFVECHSIQGTADSERYDRAIALLNRAAATPEEKKLNRMQKRAAKAQHECDDWNADVVMGTPVTVRRDDGTLFETRTRSRAFEICGHASVLVDGISGGYALERVTVRQAAAATQETR